MIWLYIRLSFRYLFKEPVLIVAYAAYYAVLNILITLYFSDVNFEQLLKTHSAKLILGIGFLTLVEAFILGVTLSGIRFVIEGSKGTKKQFLTSSFFVGLHTFFGTAAIIPIAVGLAVLLQPVLGLGLPFRLIGIGIGMILGSLLLMFKFIFPASIVVDHVGWVRSFINTFKLFKKCFVLTISMSLGMFSFWMMMLIFAELLSAIPIVGLGVFNILIQAVSAVVTAGVSLFYYSLVTESPLKIMWDSHKSDDEGNSSLK